jgi:hypothetical protein
MIRRACRILLVAVGAGLASVGVALALSYRAGTYTAGNPKGGTSIQMRVRHGSFAIQLVRYPEVCSYGTQTSADYFTFRSGSRASLTGRISRSGRLSGRYSASDGTAAVSGRVHGSHATVTGTEHGPYNPASSVSPNYCHGSYTFHARLRSG